jgi:glycosyltransferase involved in cell wall biosynthesis
MPKILRIINRFNLGGPTFNAAYLTKYLSPEFETMLIGGTIDETEESSDFILDQLGIKATLIPEMGRKISMLDDLKAYDKIKKIIRDFKPDIVHTHASKAGTLGRLAAHNMGVKVIIHTFHGHVFHSYFGTLKTQFYKAVEREMARRSTAIIAISQKQKEELAQIHKICKDEKITVIPLGFDLSRFQENTAEKRNNFRRKFNLQDDEIAIAIVGRLVPIKNHGFFLRALKIATSKTTKKIRAFVVGDGEERANLEKLSSDLNLEKTLLTFTSWIKNVDEVYAGVDIVALTSLNEGTPVSLIEAQAANKPIVSTNVGGIENVVVPETAFLSPAKDLEEFAGNLLKLIENEELRNNMSKEGWRHIREKYHYTRLVKDVSNLYLQALQRV